MFPTFIGILDIQSWWEVPSIAHFCSLFRAAFNLLDFDIEDLEEALLTDGGAEGRLLQELIVKLLEGCLPDETRNDISTFNYQMFLRRLFRKKCQEYKCDNPFNTDVDFELLPLRQKVETLRALCDFRLDAEDVECALSNLQSDSLRVEPLGHDRKNSAYWYFYGTRLYREDYIDPTPTSPPRQKLRARDRKRRRRRSRADKDLDDEEYKSYKEKEKEEDITITLNDRKNRETVWQVVCFTQQDWARLVDKFKDSDIDTEKKLYNTLAEDFLPEIPKLFELKEKQQRCRLLQRNNSRVLRSQETEESTMVRAKIKSKSVKSSKKSGQTSKAVESEDEAPIFIPPPQKKGRQTNNSLASAVGQIVIEPRDEIERIADKKGTVKHTKSTYVATYPYTFGIEEEERRVGMHKILESLKDHEDAWPFIDPVDEEYAPRYYSVVRKPMDLSTMEEKLDGGSYKNLTQFKRDFRLIVDNCRQYNGSDNEYTEMAVNLTEVFDRAVDRYLDSEQSSDESPSVSVSPPTPSPRPTRRSSSPLIALSSRKKQKKKSNKALKSEKNERKSKSQGQNTRNNEDNDDEDDENNVEDDEEDIGAITKSAVIKSKRKKYTEVEKLLLKSNKKLSAKEQKLEENRKHTGSKNKSQKGITKNSKEGKSKRKKKDDFEDDHEPIATVKSKSKKIEKRGIDENLSLIDRIKKNKKVAIEKEESDDDDDDDYRFSDSEENGKKILERIRRTRKKDSRQKLIKVDHEMMEKGNDKEKKSSRIKKQQEDINLKNGQTKKGNDKTKNGNSSPKKVEKKVDTVVSNEDLESLDRLKDRISQRRKDEKIKIDRVKSQNKSKSEIVEKKHKNKKVPSNGNTNNENRDKIIPKRSKLEKSSSNAKDNDKSSDDKKSDEKIPEIKKSKNAKGREESPAIQALNKATEQTLNDINRWLDDAPRLSEFSSGSDSPVLPASTTEPSKLGSKTGPDSARKRPNSMKIMFGPTGPPRPKKIQRTIDRLQPGKSKGNLLLKKPLPSSSGISEAALKELTSDVEEKSREICEEPKLSLGTVLKNADSIQLICKSIVSSPNPNISNDEDEEHTVNPSRSANPTTDSPNPRNQQKSSQEKMREKKDIIDEKLSEIQKPKSATPNLSAWFKAFGAPKSKKKEETEPEEIPKKEEIQEAPTPTHLQTRQRRLSAGGSSVSESVSSFSQESPPGVTIRSPQSQPVLTPTGIEQQPIRAGFYQDALSTGSSPYNSPYYATPPRYSAQLPPTPSPQNHPLSPAYPSSATYDQNPVYPQGISQTSHQVYQKPSTPENSSEVSYTSENYSQLPNSKVASPVYPQHSPQPSPQPQQSAKFSQPSPGNPSTYSQPSPQSHQQHSPYSQTSPQPPPNYSQPQPSPKQQNSPYPQTSPKPPPPSYSQVSPQTPSPYSHPQPSPQFAQPSPQPSANYSQPSPQPSVNYSQPSPQPSANYSQPSPQPSANYSQPSPQPPPAYSQPSPQPSANYSQPSPQPSANYSQPSPQPSANYSQPSPQPSANYSQPSPQPSANYSQPSPQPATNYSQPSPQVQSLPGVIQPQLSSPAASSTVFESSRNYIQPPSQTNLPVSTRAPVNYSQPSPMQSGSTPGYPQTTNQKPSPEEYHTGSYSQGFKSGYVHPTGIDYHSKSEINKIQGQIGLNPTNHQPPIYQSNQLPPPYGNNFAPADSQRPISRINPQDSGNFDTSNEALKFNVQQRQEQPQSAPSQLLSFQQSMGGHDGIYQPAGGFQAPPYPMPNPTCRPVYPSPHYYDASAKTSNSVTPAMAPVKKRMYTEPTSETSKSHSQEAPRPEQQFNYDQMMSLPSSEGMAQFDSGFSSLSDSVVNNPAYRLSLGLVGKSSKEQQQKLLSIPRTTTKDLNYSRPVSSSEIDMNLFHSLQSSAKNLPVIQNRRETTPVAQVPPPVKQKKRSKKAQQQQLQQASPGIPDGQIGMPGFPQYPPVDAIGQKNPPVIPPGGSAFNFAASTGVTNSPSFYDKDASAAAAAFAFLDEFRNPNNYYSIQQQQQAQQQQIPPVTEATQQNKLNNQPTRNYAQHPFLHSTQRSAAYGPPVSAYVTPHGPNLGLDPASYQQYLHSLYALQPPSHHRPSWL